MNTLLRRDQCSEYTGGMCTSIKVDFLERKKITTQVGFVASVTPKPFTMDSHGAVFGQGDNFFN
jgi:hypothetical protein